MLKVFKKRTQFSCFYQFPSVLWWFGDRKGIQLVKKDLAPAITRGSYWEDLAQT